MKTAQEWYKEMQQEASVGEPTTPMLERIAAIQRDALTEVVAPTIAEENDILRARLAGVEPKLWQVAVLAEEGDSEKTYTVRCRNEDDAIQLAFALDGGWALDSAHENPNGGTDDASEMLALAKCYCRIVPNKD